MDYVDQFLERLGKADGTYVITLKLYPYKADPTLYQLRVKAQNGLEAIREAFKQFWCEEWGKLSHPVITVKLHGFYLYDEDFKLYRPDEEREQPKRTRKKK